MAESSIPTFSDAQIRYFISFFKQFDKDSDGLLDASDLGNMFVKLNEPQRIEDLQNVVTMVDTDNDGKISIREFIRIFRLAVDDKLEPLSLSLAAKRVAHSAEPKNSRWTEAHPQKTQTHNVLFIKIHMRPKRASDIEVVVMEEEKGIMEKNNSDGENQKDLEKGVEQ